MVDQHDRWSLRGELMVNNGMANDGDSCFRILKDCSLSLVVKSA